jgi:uncharacterized membrane protein YbhN (UPF0104 family)
MRNMKIMFPVKAGISLLLIAIILYVVDIRKLAETFRNVDAYLFMYAAFLFPIIVLIGSEKWRQIVKDSAPGITLKESLASFLGGAAIGLLTPGRIGEVGRVLFIKKGRLESLMGIALLDKVIDLNVTLWLATYGSFVLFDKRISFLFVMASLVGVSFLTFPEVLGGLARRIFGGKPIMEKIEALLAGARSVRIKTIIICISYRFLASAIDMIQFYFLINAFAPIRLEEVVVVYPMIILTNLLQLTVGNIGIREGVAAILLARFGISPAAAVSASFLLFVLNSLIPGLMGVFFVPRVVDKVRRREKIIFYPKN